MPAVAAEPKQRRPRFRRLAEPPAFRLTNGDIAIIREIARHRFLRSTHIAKLVGRSLDRTNDRLSLLYHAGYIDRPRAQLDRFPTDGSSHMVYALADRGARLLKSEDGGSSTEEFDLSRRNKSAVRPFIEHQLEIVDFHVALQMALQQRDDVVLIQPDEIIAAFPAATRADTNPLKWKVQLSYRGQLQDYGLIPDMVFGLRFADKSRRCFMVEIDRGTMPVRRSDPTGTSFAQKMRGYLAAQAAGLHQRRYGWKAFRVLTITTDETRIATMIDALGELPKSGGPGGSLFFFATRSELIMQSPIATNWRDGNGRPVQLI